MVQGRQGRGQRRLQGLQVRHRLPPRPRPPRAGPLPRHQMVRGRAHPGAPRRRRRAQRRPEGVKPAFDPEVFKARFKLLRRGDTLTDTDRARLDKLFDAHPRLRAGWQVGAETAAAPAAGDNPERCAARRPSPRCAAPAPSRHPRAPDPPPAQPRRQPPSQQGPVAHRHGAAARPPTKHRLRRAPPRPGQHPPRDHPLPQAPHRTRDLPSYKSPTEPTCADTATNTASPSTPQPKPSTPTPPASQHSNASTTTATSPNATNNTSKSRLDKHRSITVGSSPGPTRSSTGTVPATPPTAESRKLTTCSKSCDAAPTASPTHATSKPAASS